MVESWVFVVIELTAGLGCVLGMDNQCPDVLKACPLCELSFPSRVPVSVLAKVAVCPERWGEVCENLGLAEVSARTRALCACLL